VIALKDRLRFGSRSLTAASGTTIAIVPQVQAGPTSQRRLRAFCILIHGSTIRLGSNGNGLSDVRAPRCSLRQDKKGRRDQKRGKESLKLGRARDVQRNPSQYTELRSIPVVIHQFQHTICRSSKTPCLPFRPHTNAGPL
jgi:hypothetical protein